MAYERANAHSFLLTSTKSTNHKIKRTERVQINMFVSLNVAGVNKHVCLAECCCPVQTSPYWYRFVAGYTNITQINIFFLKTTE